MWPSLPIANQIASIANILLIGSLVVGVVSTGAIVWATGVKEKYWDEDRRDSAERVAVANAEALKAQLELAKFREPRRAILVGKEMR
jgi:hypothetical protein